MVFTPKTTQKLNQQKKLINNFLFVALYNDIDELKKFITKGCVNNRDNTGYTALHYSSRKGYFEACKLLIENGADLNAVTNGGVSSLHRACMMGHENIVNLLLSKNVCSLTKDEDGQTALHRAAANGHIRIVEILLKSNENLKFIRDFKERTPYDLVSDDFIEIKSLLAL